ncbi:Uu.00g006640.m01.CDS01 [Anthostomella pinea]|uniref:Uu.00g006640.m01.CDS01 n=1 Tax=Anthostomella pinea TaxID=933095 RepID=A0AAI8VKB5_9PEZI|nr:Uu.00g006640.m01.CDS01 [Anthostomella pinea]
MAKDATMPQSPTTSGPKASDGTPPNPPNKHDASYWPQIGTKDQIPIWLRDNDFIIFNHPLPTNSSRRSLRLWRCLHMETLNIWTHALGSLSFLAVGIFFLSNYAHAPDNCNLQPQLSTSDLFAFSTCLTAATICFGLSAAFHTPRSHSYTVHHFWAS